ncbi:MAG: hypothetical protein BVN35_01245 [Proteobacteria bacterium ST_bin11]|nr:MAG: hypothetical protein BVN35_01245 [Proteobacteria bacterium ST_bin11]
MKRLLICSLLFLAGSVTTANASLLGPTSYLSFADSPFSLLAYQYFYNETFEDHLLNTPGVTATPGFVTSIGFAFGRDSVDADDGSIDGSGSPGDSYFSGAGSQGITFTFNEVILGALPDNVGIVWTDGGGTIGFEAFDAANQSLGVVNGTHADFSNGGTTAEDRFYGAINAGGISRIHIWNTSGGIEVDHLQYGLTVTSVPLPGAMVLFGSSLFGMLGLMFRKQNKLA